jgi:hypothetical protein
MGTALDQRQNSGYSTHAPRVLRQPGCLLSPRVPTPGGGRVRLHRTRGGYGRSDSPAAFSPRVFLPPEGVGCGFIAPGGIRTRRQGLMRASCTGEHHAAGQAERTDRRCRVPSTIAVRPRSCVRRHGHEKPPERVGGRREIWP